MNLYVFMSRSTDVDRDDPHNYYHDPIVLADSVQEAAEIFLSHGIGYDRGSRYDKTGDPPSVKEITEIRPHYYGVVAWDGFVYRDQAQVARYVVIEHSLDTNYFPSYPD